MKTSVLIITYNHEKFISQAIDSILMQQTDFDYEIVIGEDCSTDSTRDIVLAYQDKYPDKIKALLPERNLGMQENFFQTFKACHGQYIAMCEGDDFWTDPHKLQKQVDFLDNNSEFSICFHKVQVLENNQLKDDYIAQTPATVSTILDLANGNYIHTPSCMFRNNISNTIGSSFFKSPLGDYYLHIMNAQYGKIYYIDECMAVYRVHENSVWSNQKMAYKITKTIEAVKAIISDLSENQIEVRLLLIDSCINHAINSYFSGEPFPPLENMIIGDSNIYTLRLLDRFLALMSDFLNLRNTMDNEIESLWNVMNKEN
jgi:glycosyltransferase involved in cell wall biosynthesis